MGISLSEATGLLQRGAMCNSNQTSGIAAKAAFGTNSVLESGIAAFGTK